MSVEEAVAPIVVDENNSASLPKNCPICKKGFDKIVPKLLPCLHSFCQPCLEDQLNEQQEQPKTSSESTNQGPSTSRLKCPKCGQEFLVPSRGISSLIDNQFILESVAKPSGEGETELHVCTSCDDHSSSTSYCLNCTEWLCEACVQAHQRVRVTKDHEIKSREELKDSLRNRGRTERALYCDKHPSEKLKLFCANCERLTCRDCQLLEHKDHKYQFVNEAAGRYREYFKKRLAFLGEKIGPLAESIEAVENASKHLDHKAEVVANEIRTSSLDIIKAVKQRENVLLTELKALVHFKRKMLTKQSKDLNLMQEILTHNYEFAKHAVVLGSDVSLLFSKRQLGSRIQNLLSLKYRVTPVAHGDLKFATEAVRLCNAILKAGSVMTPTQRTSVSSGSSMPYRNPGTVSQHHNGSNMKASPLHSLNAYNNQQLAGILSGNPMVQNTHHKPSSKVYPNVVSSHTPLSGMGNMRFLNSNAIHNPQMRVMAKSLNPRTSPLGTGAGIAAPATFFPAASKVPAAPIINMRMPVQADGSAIPLHHMDSGKSSVAKSPPSYDKTVQNLRKSSCTSSSPGILENTSFQASSQGNIFAKTSRDLRNDSHEPETQDGAGVKVKIEKDITPQLELPCSDVKQEPESYCNNLCTMVTESTSLETSTTSPPSNNSSNDDWCAVCHNGGELLCCDTCPKVFHLQCHVPTLTTTPSDTWSCGLCQSLNTLQTKTPSDISSGAHKRRSVIGGMSERDTKICEKILLELFCHSDSVLFHEKVSKAVPNYYKVIQRPMDLTSIKTKLQPMHFEHYNDINEFIGDCKLIFSNCAVFNAPGSEVGKMGKRLAMAFQSILQKYLSQREENNDEPKAKRKKDDFI